MTKPPAYTGHKEPPQAASATGERSCYHCGESMPEAVVVHDEKDFCCQGCKMVYQILAENDMCRYYDIDEQAGVSLKGRKLEAYAYLDEPEIREQLIHFSDGQHTKVSFFLPQIHCASCIWLLENLYKLHPGIQSSKVNFLKKEVHLTYLEEETSLRSIVELLASIGYAPSINLSQKDEVRKANYRDRKFFYQLGVAGFAFGNIMLLSFPEYLGLDKSSDAYFFRLFGYLNIVLSLPVVFFSGRPYLESAWHGLRHGRLNIDVPITLGILTLFGRSLFEILTHTGAGYLDSLAGLVFFLLAGRWFQQRTYHHISFDRDYRSYFPIAANRLGEGEEKAVSLDRLEVGDVLRIRHEELIPTDSVLLSGRARIDYSFVSGESRPVVVTSGEKIYAGGRQLGTTIEVSTIKPVSQSYLTQLWNDEAFTKEREMPTGRISDRTGRYFTFAVLAVAFATLLYWLPKDMSTAINAFTAVLIIACPCAIALSVPFTLGNAIRILGKKGFFLKNTDAVEALAQTNAVVFDKTGTLTELADVDTEYVGQPLTGEEKRAIQSLAYQSSHPVSKAIAQFLKNGQVPLTLYAFAEKTGAGIEAQAYGHHFKIGSASFTGAPPQTQAAAFVSVDGEVKGYFMIQNKYRDGLREVLDYSRNLGPVYLLSGDNDREQQRLQPLFENAAQLHFHQSPQDKLAFVKRQQSEGYSVLMIGDGLNDAGALQQSDAGIVLTENTNNFTPACDGILDARFFQMLPAFIQFAQRSVRLVYVAYALALVYNIIGLYFAVQGLLSPVIAAILMPSSSITIALFGVLGSTWLSRRMLQNPERAIS